MSNVSTGAVPPNGEALPSTSLAADMLRGADAIACFLGLSRRQVYHLTETARLPVFKLGAVLCARRSSLLGWIEERERRAVEAL